MSALEIFISYSLSDIGRHIAFVHGCVHDEHHVMVNFKETVEMVAFCFALFYCD